MTGAFGGLVFLVGQLGLLLLVAAVLGALMGRYLWAAPRIRRLEAELARDRRNGDHAGSLLSGQHPYPQS